LAPGIFAALLYGRRFNELWPWWRRLYWTLIGMAVAYVLIALRITARLDMVYTLLGATFAPIAGALAAESLRTASPWPGPRRGVNPAGVAAWVVGFAVGVIPLAGQLAAVPTLNRVQPAAVLAFTAAFLVNLVVGRLGWESTTALSGD
jgi:cytosine permease